MEQQWKLEEAGNKQKSSVEAKDSPTFQKPARMPSFSFPFLSLPFSHLSSWPTNTHCSSCAPGTVLNTGHPEMNLQVPTILHKNIHSSFAQASYSVSLRFYDFIVFSNLMLVQISRVPRPTLRSLGWPLDLCFFWLCSEEWVLTKFQTLKVQGHLLDSPSLCPEENSHWPWLRPSWFAGTLASPLPLRLPHLPPFPAWLPVPRSLSLSLGRYV